MRKKILLVDDTLTVTALEKAILGAEYDYLEARNGAEALERAVGGRPDIILMDINMPVMNGIESLRLLKRESTTAHIPVVMVSTRSEREALDLCRSLGCADFLTKPFDPDLLAATVKRLLE
jgi:CheY-like chemotaxis protein